MVGISAVGAYIPRYRITRKTISGAMGWFSQFGSSGEKAVANYDEDSLTLAVSAARDCLKASTDRASIDSLCFASTTAPYRERATAAIIAAALNLAQPVRTADFGNSLKAGTSALLHALDSVGSGSTKSALVCAADCRLGKPGGAQETIFGDGSAALLVRRDNVVASLEGSYSVSYDFPDHWRMPTDKFDRSVEDRFIRDEGYGKFMPEAVAGLLKQYGLKPKDFARVVFPCTNARDHASLGKTMGFEPTQLLEPLLQTIGDSGTATPLMMLAAALDRAKPGDNILVLSHGGGSDALWFKATEDIVKRTGSSDLKKFLASRKEINYEQYLTFRGILPLEVGWRGEVGTTQLPLTWRERKSILSLSGVRCRRCGTPQYPVQRVCVNPDCGVIDEMEDYCFADKRGTVFSYTQDRLVFSYCPPQLYGNIDFEGGGRFMFDFTDCDVDAVQVGLPVEMTFRRKYVDEVRGMIGYFWKAMPARK